MNPKKSDNRPLNFPEWMQQTYPEKTAKRSFLKMIGALDLAYLMYRMGTKDKEETMTAIIPAMPLNVEDYKKPKRKKTHTKPQASTPAETTAEKKKPVEKKPTSPKKPTKPKTKRSSKPQPSTVADTDLTLELTHEPEPVIAPKIELQPIAEPEPLELVTEAITMDSPSPGKQEGGMERGPGGEAWLDDEALEDIDLRKSHTELKKGSTNLSFDVQDIDDEQETQIVINDTAWRAMLPSPSMNLSRMAQIVRVSYGEIYVLGRAALGAMSGEGYVSADEVARIADALAAADKKTVELDVQYHDKDKTSKKRTTSTVRIRFEQA